MHKLIAESHEEFLNEVKSSEFKVKAKDENSLKKFKLALLDRISGEFGFKEDGNILTFTWYSNTTGKTKNTIYDFCVKSKYVEIMTESNLSEKSSATHMYNIKGHVVSFDGIDDSETDKAIAEEIEKVISKAYPNKFKKISIS